ncbi:hypothetical protein AB0C10_17055 [Microbispora amethystogenes]|uniref:hypothetical protein n=1 Tax=Microbispora amethystogenes TaxID=1427754 RepID=UPI0033EF3610
MRALFTRGSARPLWADTLAVFLPNMKAGACVPEYGQQCHGCTGTCKTCGDNWCCTYKVWYVSCNGSCSTSTNCF